jgi:hypothetical protein
VGVPDCLLARSVQKYDFVFDALALQFQLKVEPRILGDPLRSVVISAQLND